MTLTNAFLLVLIVLVGLRVVQDFLNRPRKLEPLVGHVGAVLQELGKATALPGSSGNVITGVRELLGFSIGETAGSTARVRLRDGSSTGTILAVCNLPANDSKTVWFADEAVETLTGTIYMDKVSGTVEGTVYTV